MTNSDVHSTLTPLNLVALAGNWAKKKTPINWPIIPRFSSPTFFPPHLLPLTMARTSDFSHLWKETPATNMTKSQLLALANAKDTKTKELRKKNSECHISITGSPHH